MKKLLVGLLLLVTHGVAYIVGDYYGFRDTVSARSSCGRFLSRPKAEWLDDRKMELLEDFVYVDPEESAWLAPKGSKVDGASIPQLFWTWIGSPFTGKYRNASIVHDVACVRKDKPHQDVHRMFFYACMAGGVPESEAKRLYYAVARYGPKWALELREEMLIGAGPDDDDEPPKTVQRIVTVDLPSPVPTKEDLQAAEQYFAGHDPTVREIEELVESDRPFE